MPSGSITQALSIAQAYTWDQTHGYELGGMGYPDFDCSGFVGRVLHEAGFNYPAYHIGTINMGTYLINAGFIELPYDHNTFTPVNGDIFVLNHPDMSGGHTFFYAENIRAYTDYNADSANIGMVSKAKVEASSSRGNTNPGDSRKNGTGAYWEVWTHAYYQLVTGYTDNEVKVYRWLHENDLFFQGGMLLMKLLSGSRKHVRRLKGL